jgi:hypothetical protein
MTAIGCKFPSTSPQIQRSPAIKPDAPCHGVA